MSKFDAGTAVEELSYDFSKYGGKKDAVIPEPSEDAIIAFFNGFQDMRDELGAEKPIDKLTAEELEEEAANSGIPMLDMLQKYRELLATLCQNQPSEEELAALPLRVQMAFMGWLVGEYRPEGRLTGGTQETPVSD